MPTVEQNRQLFNQDYEWSKQGEEWSSVWGGSEAQWFGALLPRIHAFIPTGTILEIAPGFGRWTSYLKKYCEYLAVVDLAEECIKACQQRFVSDSHITYYVNDGKSLAMIQDKSIDFVFSFDSLVHAEAYVRGLRAPTCDKTSAKRYWVYSSLKSREIPTDFLHDRENTQ